MPSEQDIISFIESTFPSVWTLELLMLMARESERQWSRAELIGSLRASDLVVARAIETLGDAGLIVTEQDGQVQYRPVTEQLRDLVVGAATFYSRSPDKVRRIIVGRASHGLTAFADAFKIRRD